MSRAPYVGYSRDVTPSGFYLFGYLKGCLASLPFGAADALFAIVRQVLEGIETVTSEAVFVESVERPDRHIPTNGDSPE
jgi:hypothetical protein